MFTLTLFNRRGDSRISRYVCTTTSARETPAEWINPFPTMCALSTFNRCRGDSRIFRQCSHNIICKEIFAVCREPPHPTMCTNSNRGNRRERRLSTFRYVRTTLSARDNTDDRWSPLRYALTMFSHCRERCLSTFRYIRTAHPIALRGFPPDWCELLTPPLQFGLCWT